MSYIEGLETVDEFDYCQESYEFDIIALFKDPKDGKLYIGTDSGCSCPTPFETHTISNLSEVTKAEDIRAYCKNVLEGRLHVLDCGQYINSMIEAAGFRA